MNKLLLITATIFYLQICNAQTDTIDYFGQTPPGDTAKIFAPNIISLPNRMEFGITFSPDGKECYFDAHDSVGGGIFFTKYMNNTWTKQEEAPFSVDLNHNAASPFFSVDGKRLYFDYNNTSIGYIERNEGGWSEPQFLPAPINSDSLDYFYSETGDGVGYFTSNRPGGINNSLDLWRINRSPDQSLQVENLGSVVNSSTEDFSSCIAHDGSYLIFASYRYSQYSEQSLWISFNKGNNDWTVPLDMEKSGAKINIPRYWQISPSLSPDGKFLFFCHHAAARDSIHIFWVSTHILVGLKKAAYAPRLNKQIPNMNIKIDSVINYVIPDNTFSCEYGTDSLKYTATLKNGSALPSWLHFDHNTRTLSGTPKQVEIDTIKITATNIDTVSATCTFRITITSPTGVEEDNDQGVSKESMLDQNYPNPFNPSTIISYRLSVGSNVRLTIYNVLGQKIITLVNSFQSAGEHSIVWDATDERNNPVSSGIYFYKLVTEEISFQKKMLLIR